MSRAATGIFLEKNKWYDTFSTSSFKLNYHNMEPFPIPGDGSPRQFLLSNYDIMLVLYEY